ncbi:CopG family transcriptional regulator [Myceligenerans xiligouense]|uniref:Antitoxin ParD1/3/4 n=1 Tax=Myceligenerans xiligouense TaxID=253184 RepID=A0A3N4ZSM3_9MICO|nr:CopG family transcriptional regulator [Myceligenerans xiligouense]RPF22751.1 hypothetical protein EDD34_3423 [Myceligenerans xiligouense]
MIAIMAGSDFERATFTAPHDVLAEARAIAGRGEFSAYVASALRRQIERDKLRTLVDEMIERSGPVDEDLVARYMDEMK